MTWVAGVVLVQLAMFLAFLGWIMWRVRNAACGADHRKSAANRSTDQIAKPLPIE